MTVESLVAELEGKIVALSRRCIEGMYEDPFWLARFGERGRRHAEQDSEFHVKYVVAALRADDAALFDNYARWLRGVLASRGMCSRHLAESFRQLGAAMAAEDVSTPEAARAVLRSGAAALEYLTGPAAPWVGRGAEVSRLRDELGAEAYRLDELWSFFLDATDREDAPAFRAHVEFLERTLAADDAQRRCLARTLDGLRGLVAQADPARAERLFSAKPPAGASP